MRKSLRIKLAEISMEIEKLNQKLDQIKKEIVKNEYKKLLN